MTLYDIYVFKGETRFFFYPRRRRNEEFENYTSFLIECKCLYRLENETLKFCEKIEMVKPEEIDGHVLQWMSKEGISHVRGGSFIQPILSDSVKQHISEQIKFMNYDLDKNDCYIKKLQDITDVSFSLLSEKKNQIEMCKTIQQKINRYYPVVSIEELNWLRAKIVTSLWDKWTFKDIFDKYNDLMIRLVKLYKQYVEYQQSEDRDAGVFTPYLTAPHIYFDSRVIPEERKRVDREHKDDEVFSNYELMIYTLINRTDEMKFEIEGFDVEWEELKYNYCMELLTRQ